MGILKQCIHLDCTCHNSHQCCCGTQIRGKKMTAWTVGQKICRKCTNCGECLKGKRGNSICLICDLGMMAKSHGPAWLLACGVTSCSVGNMATKTLKTTREHRDCSINEIVQVGPN